ncbi:aminopeptidase P family protein [Lyngbya confervoides]|uniref:Xaa-Pro aminopeptidase n=1 Tax=Lyngbya confervoides BDU141951 TaxID=1574623 RepID=A0ABD4T504_9CYAN|nr:aminopeptidase P family protein [Lyngbya confervoides]MCM1983792.1 aminopeptidase P family protein [Lyngbya confervoides BDU141951]
MDVTPLPILQQRRARLSDCCAEPVLLWSGAPVARNFAANCYPFRASSHFLYLAGLPIMNAVFALAAGRSILYWDEASPEDDLWHGPTPTRWDLARSAGIDEAYPLSALEQWQDQAFATLPAPDLLTQQRQRDLAGPAVPGMAQRHQILAAAMMRLRLQQDEFSLAQIRTAAAVTVQAHQAGMRATLRSHTEAEVRSAIEQVFISHNLVPAYGSIVTVHGEVLHNPHYHHPLQAGDLLLVDAGAETTLGWAADVTRTWPVSGTFSPTQREIYQVVLAAHDACIEAIAPGVEYEAIHRLALKVLAAGLVDLKILRGDPESLVDQEIPSYFFPHGVGHLLGLDVHDMEDLGDLAGYAPGRQRSQRPGFRYLRLHRPLQENMVVTVEPGFYQIPALLGSARQRGESAICWDQLDKFRDVRGIRIEDDVWVSPQGPVVLTAALASRPESVEAQLKS